MGLLLGRRPPDRMSGAAGMMLGMYSTLWELPNVCSRRMSYRLAAAHMARRFDGVTELLSEYHREGAGAGGRVNGAFGVRRKRASADGAQLVFAGVTYGRG